MTHVVQAGVEELIWIVVGIFWVIAQIAGGATKKKKASPQPPSENEGGGKAPEDPLADLMRRLSGVQEIKIPTQPEPIKQTVDAVSFRMNPQGESLPRPHASTVDATSPSRSIPVQDATRTSHLRSEEIEEVAIRPTMSSFRNTLPVMKLPSMKMSFQPSVKSGSIALKIGKIIDPADKQSLRHAMLSHIIFSPPKALEEMK